MVKLNYLIYPVEQKENSSEGTRSDNLKKVWISLLSGIVIGIIISLVVYSGESLFHQYTAIYPETTVYITEQNFEVAIGSLRIIILTIFFIFIGWLSIEKIGSKFRSRNN
jgi:cell division protein FtsX